MRFRLRCKLALALLFPSVVYGQAQNLFLQPPTYPGIGTIVTSDLNSDGKADIVESDGTVLLGNGDGTFKQAASWSISAPPGGSNKIAVGDFNGDGKPDLLVANSTSLYVLLGNGDGTFQAAVGTNIGTSGAMVAADLNGDGKADVLVSAGGELFVFLGKGDGNFVPGAIYPTASAASMTTGDFNGDGKLDVALGSQSATQTTPGTIQVLFGNGDGTFRSAGSSSSGVTLPFILTAGDVNGDGKLDLVISDSDSQTVTLLGNGDGTFRLSSSMLSGLHSLALVDVNADGKLDLLGVSGTISVFSPTIQAVNVYLGNGDGTFALKGAYFAFPVLNGLFATFATADFNGDGKPDIAITRPRSVLSFDNTTILFGNGDGSFQDNPASQVGPSGLIAAVAADFNGDGAPDIAGINAGPSVLPNGDIYIALNNGFGTFTVAHTYTLPDTVMSLATADLNGDGKPDLVVATSNGNTVTITALLGNGDGSFGSPIVVVSGLLLASSLVIADFNGDHKPDLGFFVGNNNVSIFLGHGDGTFAAPLDSFAGQGPTSLVVGDFNNDSILDIADASGAGLGILLGKGDGTFESPSFPDSSVIQVFAAADLNGDGIPDLVCSGGSGGSPSFGQILLGNGDGTFSALPPTTFGTPLTVADVDGDGKPDLVFGPGVNVALGNGDGTFGSTNAILDSYRSHLNPASLGIHFLLGADFNHDKRIDIATDIPGGVLTVLNVSQPAAPDFLIAAKPPFPRTVAPGGSASSSVTITDISGFGGSVVLSCGELPSGVGCSFSPSSVSGAGTSTLTISIASSTSVGTYPVSVTGTSGNLTHMAALTLIVATSAGATTVNVAPVGLTFASQVPGTTSSPQVVELNNTGTAALTISSISISGQNSGDFSQNNTCGTGILAGSACQFSLTFTPTGMGARSAAISINDNATGSPQMVSLNGLAPDFSLSPGPSQTATVRAGQTATYTISVAPSGGFNQSVIFACMGNPALTTCSVSPNPISLNGISASTATVTIITTAATLVPTIDPMTITHGPGLIFLMFATAIMIAVMKSLVRHRSPYPRPISLGALAILTWLVLGIASCGGGSSGSSGSGGGGGGMPGTQAGTYTISVSGTGAIGSSSATHVTNLTLVVQ